jgi:hypothetical protein
VLADIIGASTQPPAMRSYRPPVSMSPQARLPIGVAQRLPGRLLSSAAELS